MDELTELRIEAAKAIGWTVKSNRGDFFLLLRPNGEIYEEYLGEFETWKEVPFNPLDSDTDCNALLVSTLSRGWRIQDAMIEDIEGDLYYALVVLYNAIINTDINITRHNLDPAAAYREAVTKACVEAWNQERESVDK